MPHHNIVVICGPTASGKTALAVELAVRCQGEIISADSRQVYHRLDIGSGKDINEYTKSQHPIPYHCINIAYPSQIYSLYNYQYDFYTAFSAISSRKTLPILCGGSGLYIESVLRGFQIPSIPEDVPLRTELSQKTIDTLKEMLLRISSEQYNKTDLSSKKRVIRSIEIAIHSTHCNTSEPNNGFTRPKLYPLILSTRWKRSVLKNRISRRLMQRCNEGMIDEVYHLRKDGINDKRLCMLGMEYKYITLYLQGTLTKETMIQKLEHAIFQLAKRQETYFRGMEKRCNTTIHWIDNADIEAAWQLVEKYFMV